jgi:hypothetical protein
MKVTLFFFFLFISFLNCFSQISFEKGYFINNSGQKIECLIKNFDWKKNPKEFEYKSSESDNIIKENILSVKEFGIYNVSKYLRSTVNIDRSSKVFGQMSTIKEPIFKEEQLFLKVLVEGKASLFKYVDDNLVRFFYKTDDLVIDQLIYKKFKTKNNQIVTNDMFRQQLLNDLRCGSVTTNDFYTLNYNDNRLIESFIKYNQCSNSEYKSFEKKIKEDFFNLSLKVGLNNSSLDLQSSRAAFANRNTEFGSQTGFKIGLELEYILPFNKNKWSIYLEPTYQKYDAEEELLNIPTATIPIDDKITVNYASIELPIGVRHYMFLNNNSKLFINAALIFDLSSSKFDFERLPDLEVRGDNNLTIGLGYKYQDRYSLEFRYATTRDLLSVHSGWSAGYKTSSIIFGYTIF